MFIFIEFVSGGFSRGSAVGSCRAGYDFAAARARLIMSSRVLKLLECVNLVGEDS